MSKTLQNTLKRKFKLTTLSIFISAIIFPVHAQGDTEVETKKKKKSADILVERIEVTARKRTETIQETPIALTAFGEDQLNTLKVRDFNDLSDGMANVTLEDVGTARGGNANFSIRGLGINSSIPSIDPTVGGCFC